MGFLIAGIIFVVISLFAIGYVVIGFLSLLDAIQTVFNKFILPELPEPNKALMAPEEISQYLPNVRNVFFNPVENSYYNPTFRRLVFRPEQPLSPIDSCLYLASPILRGELSQDVPSTITTNEVADILKEFDIDDLVIGKAEMHVKPLNFDEPPKPPEIPNLQKFFPTSKEELPEPLLSLPSVEVSNFRTKFFKSYIEKLIESRYTNEIAKYSELIRSRDEIISKGGFKFEVQHSNS